MSVVSVDQVLKYVNEARTNPKKFAQYIQKELDQFYQDGRTLPLVPGCDYSTNQGKGAWVQCKQVLETMNPLPPYKLSKSLTLAAEDHAADMAAHGFQGHSGSDGSSMSDRIYRRGQQVQVYGETISMGENIGGDFMYKGRDHALNTVKSLLIDDGVGNRGHRKNLFSNTFHYIGIGSRVVKNKIRVVMDFHTHDPVLKDSSNPSTTGNTINYPETSQDGGNGGHGGFKGFGGQFGNFGNGGHGGFKGFKGFGGNGGFEDFGGFEGGMTQFSGKGGFSGGSGGSQGRHVVSKNSSTKTSTVNGKTTKKTVVTIVYSDGSTEQEETITTN